MRDSIELVIFWLILGAKVDVSTLVLGRVAVFRRRKDSDAVPVVLDLVTIHTHLVTSDDGFETVRLAETLGDVGTKLETDTTF